MYLFIKIKFYYFRSCNVTLLIIVYKRNFCASKSHPTNKQAHSCLKNYDRMLILNKYK